MRYLIFLIPLFIFFSCKKRYEKDVVSIDTKFSHIMFDSNCKNKIKYFGIDEQEYADVKKEIDSLKEVDRLLYLFYIEEGEVIKAYNIKIVIDKTGKAKSNLYFNEKLIKLKTYNNFNTNIFYSYINSISDPSLITNRKLLVIDKSLSENKCLIIDNIKIKESQKISNLLFLDELANIGKGTY